MVFQYQPPPPHPYMGFPDHPPPPVSAPLFSPSQLSMQAPAMKPGYMMGNPGEQLMQVASSKSSSGTKNLGHHPMSDLHWYSPE